jgi:hypothetical protein
MVVPSALMVLMAATPLSERLVPPEGFARVAVEDGSFGAWLRTMPVKPGRPDVMLFDGRKKANQDAQWLVLDFDVGKRDLQQCADAVMRMFAEWQWASGQSDRICFRYTRGDRISWTQWRGRKTSSYGNFRRYLDAIFIYAGTFSLARDLRPADRIQPGDVFIQGGFPGHAVLVVDVVENARGDRMFALAQSYMPAQDIHVLRNPGAEGPWYAVKTDGKLETPEWTFAWTDLKRFGPSGCP